MARPQFVHAVHGPQLQGVSACLSNEKPKATENVCPLASGSNGTPIKVRSG
jgi:hypothetical protein